MPDVPGEALFGRHFVSWGVYVSVVVMVYIFACFLCRVTKAGLFPAGHLEIEAGTAERWRSRTGVGGGRCCAVAGGEWGRGRGGRTIPSISVGGAAEVALLAKILRTGAVCLEWGGCAWRLGFLIIS